MNSKPSLPDDADASALVLPESCSTVVAEELRVQLVMALDSDDAVQVDASGVDSIGQAVLQLLVAARRDAVAAGKPFSINNPTPAFVDRVHNCRLGEALGLPAAEGVTQ